MALTSRKSHRGPVFRCQMCPWEGDKKGVTWHVISTHREVEEAPYFCRVCPARFVTARVWRKHTSQASHRAKLILRPEQAATALGQGGLSVRFEGPESEAVQMDRGYSEKYWMLVSQASATKPLETDDEDDDEAPSLTPSNRSTPSPAKLEQRPDRGDLSYKAEERPVSAAKVSDKSTPKAEKSEMSVAKVSDKATPKAEKSEMSVAKVSDKATPKAEKSRMSVTKVSDKATPKAEKSGMSVTKVSDKATPKSEKPEKSVAKVSDKSAPRPEKKSSDRDAAHSSHKLEKQDVSTSRHGSPSPADDVIVLAPSDEETDPGLQSDWQEELDYGEDQDWEPGMCPQDTKTMGGASRDRSHSSWWQFGQGELGWVLPTIQSDWAHVAPCSGRAHPVDQPWAHPANQAGARPVDRHDHQPPTLRCGPRLAPATGKSSWRGICRGLAGCSKTSGGGKQAADSSPRATGERRKEDCWGPPGRLEGPV